VTGHAERAGERGEGIGVVIDDQEMCQI
jgi:hypothetical protein